MPINGYINAPDCTDDPDTDVNECHISISNVVLNNPNFYIHIYENNSYKYITNNDIINSSSFIITDTSIICMESNYPTMTNPSDGPVIALIDIPFCNTENLYIKTLESNTLETESELFPFTYYTDLVSLNVIFEYTKLD